jgi:hypothetical protein
MAFPSSEQLESLHEPLEFGGEGFEIVRFVYERGSGDRANVEITWRNEKTRDQATYRFRSVIAKYMWPIASSSTVSVDNVQVRQWDSPRPFRIYQPEVDGYHAEMFYAGAIERVGPSSDPAAG